VRPYVLYLETPEEWHQVARQCIYYASLILVPDGWDFYVLKNRWGPNHVVLTETQVNELVAANS